MCVYVKRLHNVHATHILARSSLLPRGALLHPEPTYGHDNDKSFNPPPLFPIRSSNEKEKDLQ
jgi:hypothetical protein